MNKNIKIQKKIVNWAIKRKTNIDFDTKINIPKTVFSWHANIKILYRFCLKYKINFFNLSKLWWKAKKKKSKINLWFQWVRHFSLASRIFFNKLNCQKEYKFQFQTFNKLKLYYQLTTKQFIQFFKQINKKKNKKTLSKEAWLILCFEYRLDVILYRMWFASSLYWAWKLIENSYIMVNGEIITQASYFITIGNYIQLLTKKKNYFKKSTKKMIFARVWRTKLTEILKAKIKFSKRYPNKPFKAELVRKRVFCPPASHIEVNFKTLSGILINWPKIYDITYPFWLKIQAVWYFRQIWKLFKR